MKFFDEKKKKKISFFCLGFTVLWIILWNIFPYDFYSIFFASSVGSNVMLVLLELVLIFPTNYVFTRIVKGDLHMVYDLVSSIVCMTALAYTYSIFRYSAVFWVILPFIVHLAAGIFIVGHAYEGENVVLPLIKRKPLRAAGLAAARTAVLDGVFLLLFTVIARIMANG